MARPRSPEPYIQWNIHLDAQIAARVEMQLFDPIRGKPRYGARHELINELLRNWLESQERPSAARETRTHA